MSDILSHPLFIAIVTAIPTFFAGKIFENRQAMRKADNSSHKRLIERLPRFDEIQFIFNTKDYTGRFETTIIHSFANEIDAQVDNPENHFLNDSLQVRMKRIKGLLDSFREKIALETFPIKSGEQSIKRIKDGCDIDDWQTGAALNEISNEIYREYIAFLKAVKNVSYIRMDLTFRNYALCLAAAMAFLGLLLYVFSTFNIHGYWGEPLILKLRTGMSPQTVEGRLLVKLESADEIVKTLESYKMNPRDFLRDTSGGIVTEIGGVKLPLIVSGKIKKYYSLSTLANTNVLMIFLFFENGLFSVSVQSGILKDNELSRFENWLEEKVKENYEKDITSIQNEAHVHAWTWRKNQAESSAVVFKEESIVWMESSNKNYVTSSSEFLSSAIEKL